MPRIIGYLPADRWENEVLKALKNQLPVDWVVMPSVKWTLTKNGYVRDGEADFVVLIPDSGLVVLEVKGSKAFRVAEDGRWMRKLENESWTLLWESPPEQATRNMHDLIDILMARNEWSEFPGRFSYIVVYPRGETDDLPLMFDESTIATRRHMAQLATRIRNSLEKRGGSDRSIHFSSTVVETIVDQLKNRAFQIHKADTADDVASDFTKIEQLTRQQFACLRGLFQIPNIAVVGPAGSGKTILAMWRLQSLVAQGLRPAYVCYNRSLADFLRLRNPEYAQFIWSVDRLFLELCPESRHMAGQGDFHRQVLPGLVMDRASQLLKYDAILVDEGQDLSEEQIIALTELISRDGSWAFFADWNQDVYGAGKGSPIGADVVFHLHHNCRNTVRINDASNQYLNKKIESMTGMPLGVLPLVESSGTQSMRVWELAKQWSGEGSVAVLSPFRLENSSMKNQVAGHGLRLSTDLRDLGKPGTVFFSTIKSFKGIEAAAVIVVDVGIPGDHVGFSEEDLYVACTRATTRLALLSSRKDVASHFRLSA